MSHVDEGMLHAYLDGALGSFPAVQAEQVRRHLDECDECRARLEEEQAVRDEAAAILGGASLDVGDMPSFEELRARARSPRGAPAGAGMQRLAWAATVVLALGTGWLLRGGVPRPGASLDVPEDRVEAAPPPVGAEAGRPADVSGAGLDPSASVGSAPPAVAPPAGATTQGAPAAKALADRDVRVAEAEDVPAGDSAVAPETASPADLWAAARERQTQERLAAQRALPAPTALVEPPGGRASMEPRPEEARRAVNLVGSGMPAPGDAATDAGASLVVPGLTVVSVTWLDDPGLAGAVRVLQFLEGGDTVELIHLPVGVDPSLLPAPGDGRTQVLSPRDGGWLVLRGRTSADELSGLLRRLGGGD